MSPPLRDPVVEIDNQNWTPYMRFHLDPVPLSLQAREQSRKSRQESSSPIFISAKVASTSSSSRLDNRPNGHTQRSLTQQTNGGLNNGFHHHTNGLDSLTRDTSNHLLKADYKADYSGALQRKDKPADEIVYPPITEPCLRSIFDDELYGPCVWSPSHRLGKVSRLFLERLFFYSILMNQMNRQTKLALVNGSLVMKDLAI